LRLRNKLLMNFEETELLELKVAEKLMRFNRTLYLTIITVPHFSKIIKLDFVGNEHILRTTY